jgi:glycosyltransferase involved in cell wall biosynthesis
MKLTVIHLTTAHFMDDARIFNRECRSIARLPLVSVKIAAHGCVELDPSIEKVSFGLKPSNRVLRILRSQFIGIKMILTNNPSIWHFHDPELLPIAAILIKCRRRVIWDAHEDYFLQFDPKINYRSYLPPILRRIISYTVMVLLKYVDRNSYAVIAATETIARTYSNKRTVVVGNEAIVSEFETCQPKFEAKRLLFIGPTTNAQSFFEVIDAVATIKDITLTLIGKEPSTESWNYGTNALGARIEYLGWKDRSELALEISNSALGLITYNDNEINATNSPNKLFEFSAAGLPCIATPTQSNSAWVKQSQGAVLARGFSSKDLALAINNAFSDKSEWLKMSVNIRTWSRTYGNWSNSEERLLNVYRQAFMDLQT